MYAQLISEFYIKAKDCMRDLLQSGPPRAAGVSEEECILKINCRCNDSFFFNGFFIGRILSAITVLVMALLRFSFENCIYAKITSMLVFVE